MAKRPTILDVAQQSGFSKSTVSLVLQDSPEIPEKTKVAVRRVMARIGYRQNRFARSLRTRRSHVVGMLIQDHLNPFYAQIVQEVEQLLRQSGYDLLVSSSNTDLETEEQAIEHLFSMGVDGMIVSTMDYERVKPLLLLMQERGTHCVVAGPAYPGIPFDAATINDRNAMREVMEHLFGLGHRDIGFIWGAPAFQSIGARFNVFRQELEAAGLSIRQEWVRRCGFRIEDGYRAASELFALPERPTAVFALNDLLALATIRAAKDMGLRVPEDVSVVGADNVDLAMSFIPSLTTIDQPIREYATELTRLVLTGIDARLNAVHPTADAPATASAAITTTATPSATTVAAGMQADKGATEAAGAEAGSDMQPRRVELVAGFIARESTGSVPVLPA